VELSTSDARSKFGYGGAREKTSCRPEDVHHGRNSRSPPRRFQWLDGAGLQLSPESRDFFLEVRFAVT
jgi:hypothetical protein